MRNTTGLVFSLGAVLALSACGDDGGDGNGNPNPDNPAFTSVFPDNGFTNRSTTVVIIGEDTAFSADSVIDFGEGITVSNAMATGSTGVVVDLEIAGNAATGPRDVIIDGLTLAGGYTVEPPIDVVVVGTRAQGSIVDVVITNKDPENPFDTSDGATTLATGAAGVLPLGSAVSSTEVSTFVGINVTAATGTADFTLTNGALVDSFSFDVAARTATPLNLTDGASGTFAANGDSELYTLTTTTGNNTFINFPQGTGNLVYLALNTDGSFATILNIGFSGDIQQLQFVAAADQQLFIIAWDITAMGAGAFTMGGADFAADPANTVSAVENGTDAADALAVTLPGLADSAAIDSDDDLDWFSVTIGAADANKALYIATNPIGATSTADTIITLFAADDLETPIAASDDAVFFDSLGTPALAEGDYLVRITDSAFAEVDPTDAGYTVTMGLGSP